MILVAAGYYSRFSLSYRDVSEILKERGISVRLTIIMPWVHENGSLIYQVWKRKNTNHHYASHIKGIETIHPLYKQRRSLQRDSVFSTYNELQQILATS
ncbi:hypothetical protein OF830_22795 [Bacillus paramycoides]|uniref:hypothetical protein n=1 Tax=Bacillus paramycoides TaxID=2026194 RepID=UPI0022442C7A|nr:hypothetical protein [Bacillus paramycoides]